MFYGEKKEKFLCHTGSCSHNTKACEYFAGKRGDDDDGGVVGLGGCSRQQK